MSRLTKKFPKRTERGLDRVKKDTAFNPLFVWEYIALKREQPIPEEMFSYLIRAAKKIYEITKNYKGNERDLPEQIFEALELRKDKEKQGAHIFKEKKGHQLEYEIGKKVDGLIKAGKGKMEAYKEVAKYYTALLGRNISYQKVTTIYLYKYLEKEWFSKIR